MRRPRLKHLAGIHVEAQQPLLALVTRPQVVSQTHACFSLHYFCLEESFLGDKLPAATSYFLSTPPREQRITKLYPRSTNKMAAKAAEGASFYESEENIRKLCNFLRSRDGVAVREALLMEKRVHYLKGKSR